MSFFGNFTRRMIESRQRQADAYVGSVIANIDDETLKQAGLDRSRFKTSSRGSGVLL